MRPGRLDDKYKFYSYFIKRYHSIFLARIQENRKFAGNEVSKFFRTQLGGFYESLGALIELDDGQHTCTAAAVGRLAIEQAANFGLVASVLSSTPMKSKEKEATKLCAAYFLIARIEHWLAISMHHDGPENYLRLSFDGKVNEEQFDREYSRMKNGYEIAEKRLTDITGRKKPPSSKIRQWNKFDSHDKVDIMLTHFKKKNGHIIPMSADFRSSVIIMHQLSNSYVHGGPFSAFHRDLVLSPRAVKVLQDQGVDPSARCSDLEIIATLGIHMMFDCARIHGQSHWLKRTYNDEVRKWLDEHCLKIELIEAI